MDSQELSPIDARALGARLRQAREDRGLTQDQVAQHLGVARTTVVAIEKGERRVRAEELVELSFLLGRRLSSLLQGGEPIERLSAPPQYEIDQIDPQETIQILDLTPSSRQDEMLPTRFRTAAVESWQKGDLTEGQLARILRVNRLQAREIIQAAMAGWWYETLSG